MAIHRPHVCEQPLAASAVVLLIGANLFAGRSARRSRMRWMTVVCPPNAIKSPHATGLAPMTARLLDTAGKIPTAMVATL